MNARVMVVLNPHAIDVPSHLEDSIRSRLACLTIEVARTARPGHATELARSAVRDGYRVVVAAGGDGTVNEILPALVGSETALGIVPAGTANDLARHLGMPRDVAGACDAIRTGIRRQIDVIRVNGRFLVTGGGIGLPCDVARAAHYLKTTCLLGRSLRRVLHGWIYLAGALLAVLSKRDHGVPLRIASTQGVRFARAMALNISNQPFIGSRFQVSPRAINDDGLFDVCLIHNPPNRAAILRIVQKALSGSLPQLPTVHCWRSRKVRIELDRPRPFLLDGEITPAAKTFDVGILPAALSLIAPKDDV
jgi:YegS/Rv2252/BmrU family lipid kinase